MGADHEALQDLEADPRFGELNDYVPPLALVRAFGVSRDEVAHSGMLSPASSIRGATGARGSYWAPSCTRLPPALSWTPTSPEGCGPRRRDPSRG